MFSDKDNGLRHRIQIMFRYPVSGNEDSIEIMLSKQITELYPISGLFMQHTNFSMYIGVGSFIAFSTAVCIFVKIVSMKYGLLNTLAKTTSKYCDNKKYYNRKSIFFPCIKKNGTLFKLVHGGLECRPWCNTFMCF